VIETAQISAIDPTQQAIRQREVGCRRTAATYPMVSIGTSSNASGFHDHA
jgi:hypothetical protein